MKQIRILLVDDHLLFRKGIASFLEGQPDIKVVAEAANGMEAINKIQECNPDLVLMDVHMPVMSGIEAVRIIRKEYPKCIVVMFSISEDDEDLFQAIKNGAQGYLLKNMEPDDLLKQIRGLRKGEAALSPLMASKILKEFAELSHRPVKQSPTTENLTSREKEVLSLVAQGITNREIASRLAITENTVKNHLCNIMEKLHLENRVQLATFAMREGLVEDETV
ncbi:MAG: two component transcriptional regulator, LuxR family [Peptococcaceae bacterium]|jgi:DNA-binding NarL/FixJ family response regulator|nr:two component transcriptional regulator, LuxR family [Peptococcaceae bacterium]